ncbi:MAG: TonB-dependent receptor, partial [Cytophaga sp.]|nr:TonB-dependent receptor [Cytophaga sp.]
MNNKILLIASFAVISQLAFAQKFSIKGQVVDTLSGALPMATVMLMNPKDSSLVNFGVTSSTGNFELKNISKGAYQLKITFIGLAPYAKNLSPSDFTTPVMDMGQLKMKPVSSQLDELVIHGDKAPITFKRDTIEYNASSFKTKPNANVEDMLKKMPGIEVQSDGSIKAQGETVQRVTVDGREFFGRDPKLATRNLPADAIDKVQVF